jgi:phospholipid/cholesterol/gamma-HCH transport system substrate-binding protein
MVRSGGARADEAGRALPRRALGLAFLLVLALLAALAVAAYRKTFVPVVPVTVLADRVGNQLTPGADVKLRGIVVGDVRSIRSTGDGASLRLALDPDAVHLIPADVTVRLLPKTLFGERYVALVVPPRRSPVPIRAGAVIGQDRTTTAIELERVFADLLPLLRTVQPAKLAATLTALAEALRGRGDRTGRNLADLGAYLRRLNPALPALVEDIRGVADVADTYQAAAPDLLGVLADLTVTSRTVVARQAQLAALLRTTTTAADETRGLLADNAERLIRLAAVSRPTLELLARYAPEYPCLLAGLAAFTPRAERLFAGGALHITLEVVRDRGKYVPGDEPAYAGNRGPDCHGLPSPPVPFPQVHVPDGSAPRGTGSLDALPSLGGGGEPSGFAGPGPDLGIAGGPAERRLLGALLAPSLATTPDQVPDIAPLLFAPLARGMEVHAS